MNQKLYPSLPERSNTDYSELLFHALVIPRPLDAQERADKSSFADLLETGMMSSVGRGSDFEISG